MLKSRNVPLELVWSNRVLQWRLRMATPAFLQQDCYKFDQLFFRCSYARLL